MKIKRILLLLLLLTIITIIFISCSTSNLNLSSYEYQPKTKSQIFSQEGDLIGEVYNENRTYVELDKIPDDLKNAIIAVEDTRFYSHSGFDVIRLVKAIFTDIKTGQLKEGASTITQQLAKNLFLTNEKTFTRKIKELAYSLQLERKYTKDQILEIYLNEIYLGQMVYGVQEASIRFFGKNVWELSLAESALIAGLPQAPSAYDPTKHLERAKNRQEIVLNRMISTGDITQDQAEEAKHEDISILEKKDNGFSGKYREGSQHFINQVMRQLTNYFAKTVPEKEKLNKEEIHKMALYQIENGGFKIYTSLNLAIQERAVQAIKDGIESNGLGDKANGALVSIEPSTGKVLAYYGGLREIDMANKPRRPGSTIKPLYFAGAINEGLINGNTIVFDEPTDFNGYKPKNYGNKYLGYVTAREVMVNSLNNSSIKIMDYLGVSKTIEYLTSYGITTIVEEDNQLATGLGGMTYGISPLELSNAYGVIPNDGLFKEAYFIEKIEDFDGKVIYKNEDNRQREEKVLSAETAAEIEDLLIDVVNRGTGTNARLDYYTGGKTGTTDNRNDLWFVGFIKPIVTSIWLGNEDNHELNGSSSVSANIYREYMHRLLNDQLISKEGLIPVTNYDNTTSITILLPERGVNELGEINQEDIAEITIPFKEYSYFQDRIVEKLEIDSSTGKLFVEGRCSEENKEIRVYLQGQGPKEQCDNPHFFDNFYHFFDNFRIRNNGDNGNGLESWNTEGY